MKNLTCFYQWENGALLLHVYVQPGAKKNKIVGLHANQLKIALAAQPIEGQANAALIKFFAKLFAVRQQQIQLVRGEKGRAKLIKIQGEFNLPEELVIYGLNSNPV